ncbi:invasion associated locus B family protein [Ponticoccus sp. (in: a-proteobacteria)]|uniref:invasion associated locus B family protein n=1 Tax=Ponticoccus sp. (in: a-proteobacteria) TaxID=1925025 RepID=UPI003AB359C9
MCRTKRPALASAALLAVLAASQASAQERAEFDRNSRKDIGDWVVECVQPGEPEPGACQLYQRVLTQDPNVAAMVVALAWTPAEGALRLQLSLPLGTDLTRKPVLSIDGEAAEAFSWSRCLARGCLVEAPLSQELIARLAQGSAASITIAQPNSNGFQIPISLAGFRSGIGQITPPSTLPEQSAPD